MAQNIYDNVAFFDAYSQMGRSLKGLDGAAEWPTIRAMLPDLNAKRVIDLGCGYGWFCRWARQSGAAHVHGVDLSERMLDRARSMTEDARIVYEQGDLDQYELPEDTFDLVYSSLAFHYLENLDRLIASAFRSLLPGGYLVFSVEHPIFTSPMTPGWMPDSGGRQVWPLSSYHAEGPRTTDWLVEGVIKQHRTMATYLQLLLQAGFQLRAIQEWGPTVEEVQAHPDWGSAYERPIFLLIAAER